jgi:hypothetical protein
MHQLRAPGGFCTSRNGEVTFQATAQPMSHPWPEPAVLRLEKAMPGVRAVVFEKRERSTSSPVAQRWCGATPRASLANSRTTTGPVTVAWVTTGQTPSPETLQRLTRICVPESEKSAGAAAPLCAAE